MKYSIWLIILVGACNLPASKLDNQNATLDYTNKIVLDSLLQNTQESRDTLFLGFNFGMSKADFKNQIDKLKSEGKNLTFSHSNRFSNMTGTFDLGEGYTFKTRITFEDEGTSLIGAGSYFLIPEYNKKGLLNKLNILSIEEWESGYSLENESWLESKIKINSNKVLDRNFKKALADINLISEYSFLRQRSNLIIYKGTVVYTYVHIKSLYEDLLAYQNKKDEIKDEHKNVKF